MSPRKRELERSLESIEQERGRERVHEVENEASQAAAAAAAAAAVEAAARGGEKEDDKARRQRAEMQVWMLQKQLTQEMDRSETLRRQLEGLPKVGGEIGQIGCMIGFEIDASV